MPDATAPPSVPRLLARLKLQLTINRIKTAKAGRVNAVVASIFAVFIGFMAFLFVSASASFPDPADSQAFLVIGATALLVGWLVLPLVTLNSDETLDPARLQLLPLRERPLMIGLLGASFIGFAPAAVIVGVSGAILGYGRGLSFVIVVAAVAVLLLLSAATARMTSTLLVSRLTSRRGRDAMIVVASLLALSVQLLRFISFSSIDRSIIDTTVAILRWTPPGMLGQAIIDARDGAYATALAEVVAPAALLPIVLVVWGNALERSLTVVTGGVATKRREGHRRSPLVLLFDRLPFVTATPTGAVAARELRYLGRDPRRKVGAVNTVLIGIGLPVFFAYSSRNGLQPGAVLLGSIAGYLVLLGAMNQFGLDGPALWVDVVSGIRIRDELVGKNLALLVYVLPVVAVSGVALAALSGGWAYLPAAVTIAAGGLGAGLAVANVVSVRFPQRLPETRSPFAGASGGQGCMTGLIFLMCIALQGVLLLPVAIAGVVLVAVGPVATIVIGPAVALYGWLLWRAGVQMAEQYAYWRQPELLAAVDPRRSG